MWNSAFGTDDCDVINVMSSPFLDISGYQGYVGQQHLLTHDVCTIRDPTDFILNKSRLFKKELLLRNRIRVRREKS